MTGELRKLNVSDFNNACLVLNHHIYRLMSNVTKIGRHFENDCVIDDLTVSRRHAEIRQEGGIFVLYDLESTSGTFVNNILINSKTLKSGDIIALGNFPMIFVLDGPQKLTTHNVVTGQLNGTDLAPQSDNG